MLSVFHVHRLLPNGCNRHLFHPQSLELICFSFGIPSVLSFLSLVCSLGSPVSPFIFCVPISFFRFASIQPIFSSTLGGFPRVPWGCLLGRAIWTMLSPSLCPLFLQGCLSWPYCFFSSCPHKRDFLWLVRSSDGRRHRLVLLCCVGWADFPSTVLRGTGVFSLCPLCGLGTHRTLAP